MDMARLFIGVPLPESCQEGLERLERELKAVVPGSCSWTRPGNWHVTLKFLGDVPEQNIPDLKAALSLAQVKPFAFRPGGGGYFPSMRRPRVIWVGAARGGQEMAALAREVDAACGAAGFAPEERAFTTHLTVARVKSQAPGADWGRPLAVMLAARWPEIAVDRFVLWRSYLGGYREGGGPPGPRHIPLGEYGASGGSSGSSGPGEPVVTGSRPG